MANSSIFVLPTEMQPAFSKFSITVAVYGGTKLLRIFEPHVVRRPFVQNKSFCAIGIPASDSSEGLLSKYSAFFIEFSSFKVIKAFKPLLSSIRLNTS